MVTFLALEGAMSHRFLQIFPLSQLPSLDLSTRRGLARLSKGLVALPAERPVVWHDAIPNIRKAIALALGEMKMEWQHKSRMLLWRSCEAARKGGKEEKTCVQLLEGEEMKACGRVSDASLPPLSSYLQLTDSFSRLDGAVFGSSLLLERCVASPSFRCCSLR